MSFLVMNYEYNFLIFISSKQFICPVHNLLHVHILRFLIIFIDCIKKEK